MRIKTLIATVLFAQTVFTACDNLYKDVAGTKEVEELRKELSEVKNDRKALQEQYIGQNKEMSAILEELASITGRTSDLRVNVENGSARLTQAEQISGSIESLKSRIAALERKSAALSAKNTEFARMIDGFNKVIAEQESQISALKKDIEEKNITIRNQGETIKSQDETIARQRDDLQRRVEEQARMLFEAGVELESIGDSAPEVSWKKNKQKVSDMQQSLYKSALSYYNMALEAGYDAKANIYNIQQKIK